MGKEKLICIVALALLLIHCTIAIPRSCDNCQCAEDPCPPWWVDRDDRMLFDYNTGQVSVSSSATATVKYPEEGKEGQPQAYISTLSGAKSDPDMPVTINDGATEEKPKVQWGYKDSKDTYGPEEWYKLSPQCAGMNQSPINIATSTALQKPLGNPIKLTRDEDEGGPMDVQGKLINNGKTIGFNVPDEATSVHLSGGVLGEDSYVLKQFHLHFGCSGSKGSEHTLDGESFSGEIHLVFKNIKYTDPKVAMQQKDGLAIVAFFLQENPGANPNPAFGRIADSIVHIQKPKEQYAIADGLSLKNLIPAMKEGLTNLRRYVYKGSLPTPPCYQSVTWVVFRRPVGILPDRLKKMRNLYSENADSLCGNVRPIQKLNGREVFSFARQETPPATTLPPTTRPPPTTAHAPTTKPATTLPASSPTPTRPTTKPPPASDAPPETTAAPEAPPEKKKLTI